MAELQGTLVASKIVPTDSLDTFATHDEKYGRGGYRTVADLSERDAITLERRREGMLVNVLSENVVYKLIGGLENTNWEVFTSGSVSSTSSSYIAGETVPGHRAVMINTAGKVVLASPEEALSFIGIAMSSASLDETIKVVTSDACIEPSWTWIPGKVIYFMENGVLTQTPPSMIASTPIGVATSTSSLLLQKMSPIFLI